MSEFPDDLLRERLPEPGHWSATELRKAAVLCAILKHQGLDHLLFVMRPKSMPNHGGQIGFPGGMMEPGEAPLATAVREAEEEVGMPAAAIEPLGELPPLRSTSNITVHCIVARVAPFALRADPREVERVLHVPLAELRQDDRWQDKPPPFPTPDRQPLLSPHFAFGQDLLWGLTARFVRDLTIRLTAT